MFKNKFRRNRLTQPLEPGDISIFSGFFTGLEENKFQFDLDLGLDFWIEKEFEILGQPKRVSLDLLRNHLEIGDPVVVERVSTKLISVWAFDEAGGLYNLGDELGFQARGRKKRLASKETEDSIKEKLFKYPAKVVYSYDADTSTVDIELGFGCTAKSQSIRYFGINAPEMRGTERPQGLISKAALLEIMPNGSEIIFQAIPEHDLNLNVKRADKGKFGRWLGIIWVLKGEENINVNQYLLDNGFAEEYFMD